MISWLNSNFYSIFAFFRIFLLGFTVNTGYWVVPNRTITASIITASFFHFS